MSDWRKPYEALWQIADAATFEEMARLWAELDGPARLKALRRRVWRYMQSPYGRRWHGTRPVEKASIGDDDLNEALTRLHLRISGPDANPVFGDPRLLAIGAPGEAILNEISHIRVWTQAPEKRRRRP